MICKIDSGDKAREQIKSPNYVNSNFSTESKHGWCVRHLKQPPHQLNTTSFEDSGLNPFYNNLWYKGFFFRDKLAHLCSFRPRRSLQEVKVWPRSRRWGKVARLVRGLKDDFGAFWNYRAFFHVTASSLPGLPLESGCCHRNLRRFQPSQFIQPLWLEVEVLSWNISKMNLYLLDDKWTKTDLTDQIAKLHEFTFFHRVAFESKHGWCVRHLKHHSNLSPTHASSISAKYECLGMFRASPQGSAWNSWAFSGIHVFGDSVSFSQGLHRGWTPDLGRVAGMGWRREIATTLQSRPW